MFEISESNEYIYLTITKGSSPYRIGYPKSSLYTKTEILEKLEKTEAFTENLTGPGLVPVNWIPDQPTKSTEELRKLGINDGYVITAGGIILYNYTICFTCDSPSSWLGLTYVFHDSSTPKKDMYKCWVWRGGRHTIDYDSDKPTITAVTHT